MPILMFARKRKHLRKSVTAVILSMTVVGFAAICFPGVAYAGGIGDVITQVANNNYQDPEFNFGTENVTGYGFKMHAGYGGYGQGYSGVTVLGPVEPSDMEILLDHVDSETEHTTIQTKKLKGCEVREYTMEDGNGVGVILPDYFITVETYQSGNSRAADLDHAKNIAQQVLDGLEKNGLLSAPAPQVEGAPADEPLPAVTPSTPKEEPKEEPPAEEPADKSADSAPAVTGKPLDEPQKVSNNDNIGGVKSGPTAPSTFSISSPHLVTYIRNYHWNSGRGANPGLIGLVDQNGKVYGPWQASGTPGQGGVPNANWEVFPNIVVPAGTYTITDSDSATWATNAEAGGKGMGEVRATPNFEVTGGSLDDLTGENTLNDGFADISDDYESPAGVGSVGNIPGPSNATEAVVGVAVPGLVATVISVLAGAGSGFVPPGGTGIPPDNGGPIAGGGSPYPGSGTPGPGTSGSQPAGMAQDTMQLGRRRRGGIKIDTDEMGQGTISMPGDQNIQPGSLAETGVFVDAGAMTASTATGGTDTGGIMIDTSAFGVPDQAVTPTAAGAAGMADSIGLGRSTGSAGSPGASSVAESGILIDTSGLDVPGSDPGMKAGGQTAGLQQDETVSGIYDQDGFDPKGYDREGFDRAGYDREGYNREGYNLKGYNREGFDQNGFDKDGFNKEGFNKDGYDKEGFNRQGYDAAGYDRDGYNQSGYDAQGFNRDGFDQRGFDQEGFNRDGFNQRGFDREGYNRQGYDQAGYDRDGFNQSGYNQEGFNREGFDHNGYDRDGFNQDGYNASGYDREGFNRRGFDQEGYDREGFSREGFNKEGYDRDGYDKSGFDQEGFDHQGYDQNGLDKEGFNRAGFDKEGFDREGFNKDGFDREGYGRNGFNAEGFDREGFDVNGYNAKGFNRSGYNAQGYDAAGYDKQGFNQDGWDREGYDRNGFNAEGYDRRGYDKAGYDKEGYDQNGFDREGHQREGYDEYGYDKDGFNKDGFDRDGYDRQGFDYEGYNRAGYDPWGYDKHGYNKDGYHWSGYNADGYDRNGLHWSQNPYEEGSPFAIGYQDPFDERNVIPYGADWKPTKPPLGEPYPKTLEKYGAKPWTDEPAVPEPPAQTDLPQAETQVEPGLTPGQDDPPAIPETKAEPGDTLPTADDAAVPENVPESDLPPDSGDPNTFTYTDPETGETTTYEYNEGYTGPRHGETQTLVGKTDGRTYELEFNAVKGKWINTETGGEFNVDDFDRFQNDLAIDKARSAADLEKMAKRMDANSKAIDKNLADWQKLEQMQKVADKHNIGESGGPGDVDKAIQKLKDDMLAGKELDQEKMDKIRRVIDDRILGKTTADSGERFEDIPWYKDIDSAFKANAATVKEVVTGEKDDGSTSWLGIGARIMITAATGGTAQVVMDGTLTVAEAMYRIKDAIDKGESDFRAVSKAIGMVVLGEELGWLAGKGGGKLMQEMAERFPAFTNKAADLIEKGVLVVVGADQLASYGIGLVSKESAEEMLDQINKRLVDLGSDTAQEGMEKAAKGLGLGISSSADDLTKGMGKAVSGSGDDLAKGTGKSISSSDELAAEAGQKATGKSAAGKSATSSGDDIVKPSTKGTSGSADASAGGSSPNRGSQAADGPEVSAKPQASSAGTDDAAGKAAGKTADDSAEAAESAAKASGEAGEQAEATVKKNLKDYDKLPESKQKELIDSQDEYDRYVEAAGDKGRNIAEKVQKGEDLSTEDLLNMKSDPAAMRKFKKVEGITDLPEAEARKVQTAFNDAINEKIYKPSYNDVENHLKNNLDMDGLKAKYGDDIQVDVTVETIRTPGKEYHDWDINTDNDIHSVLTIKDKNGNILEVKEIPRSEWETEYFKSYTKNTGMLDKSGSFNLDLAKERYPDVDWKNMKTDAERCKAWAELHEETPTDVFHPEAARDFSTEKTAILNGKAPEVSPAAAAKRGEGTLLDAEQLGEMESYKIGRYWNEGSVKSQTEALEQLGKLGEQAKGLEKGYAKSFKIEPMPAKMDTAINIAKDQTLSPAMRAAKLKELGFDGPGDLANKLASRIHALRIAVKK